MTTIMISVALTYLPETGSYAYGMFATFEDELLLAQEGEFFAPNLAEAQSYLCTLYKITDATWEVVPEGWVIVAEVQVSESDLDMVDPSGKKYDN